MGEGSQDFEATEAYEAVCDGDGTALAVVVGILPLLEVITEGLPVADKTLAALAWVFKETNGFAVAHKLLRKLASAATKGLLMIDKIPTERALVGVNDLLLAAAAKSTKSKLNNWPAWIELPSIVLCFGAGCSILIGGDSFSLGWGSSDVDWLRLMFGEPKVGTLSLPCSESLSRILDASSLKRISSLLTLVSFDICAIW